MEAYAIDIHKKTTPGLLYKIIQKGQPVQLADSSKKAIVSCREYLDSKLASESKAFYGINTGFGSLYNTVIAKEHLSDLQHNLLKSHACGMGDEVPQQIVQLMLLLKIQSLSYGHSGVNLSTVQRLVDMYNAGIVPVVYEQGSLGASGDLAPLAHLCLPLIGLGEVHYQGQRMASSSVLEALGWEPLKLAAKEGLALINGTQFMSAYGSWCIAKAQHLSRMADVIATVSLDAFDGRPEAFDIKIGKVRPHTGHLETSLFVNSLLQDSELIRREKKHVQDPYSFRCIPQVHGASKDVFRHVEEVLTTEVNAVTDNPNIFPEEDEILSGGNFHGQPLAMPLDYLAIGLAELGSISERRIYLLISGQRDLPPFLTRNAGLNSGFMIAQYTAASIVSQNKQLCTPASVDSIVSSNGQEDHVSMGANAATKCLRVLNNLHKILAIELMTAAQALEFRRPEKSSPVLEALVADFRTAVPFVKEDVEMHGWLQQSVAFLNRSHTV